MYTKVFLVRNSSFQENVKTKVYALEDSLGVEAAVQVRETIGLLIF